MPADRPELAALDVLAGEWTEQVALPGVPAGRSVFEWALGGRCLFWRSESPQPEFPDSFSVIAADEETGRLTAHYFDSRGVVRLYRMELGDGVWRLVRTEPDFSPLDFAQRFEGVLSADGNTVEGRWETSHDGGNTWEIDFPLRFTRVR